MDNDTRAGTEGAPAVAAGGPAGIHALGQRLWLDSIGRELLTSGALARYIDTLAVTGLTSNPTLFADAIAASDQYDAALAALRGQPLDAQARFFVLAVQDLQDAADLLRPLHAASAGQDGWASLEVSPLLAHDRAGTLAACLELHAQANRPNLFIKVPGTRAGLAAVEDAMFEGVPVNITLLFTPADCAAAASACLRAIERRIVDGRDPDVASVASLFVSRWDQAANISLPPGLHDRLGIAMAMRALRDHRVRLQEPRWRRILAAGARPQRLLWASTGSKPASAGQASAPVTACHYLDALVAPGTIDTLPLRTLQASAAANRVPVAMPEDGGDSAWLFAECRRWGLGVDALGAQLQQDGIAKFAAAWHQLLESVAAKS